jgi:hypothetical protein
VPLRAAGSANQVGPRPVHWSARKSTASRSFEIRFPKPESEGAVNPSPAGGARKRRQARRHGARPYVGAKPEDAAPGPASLPQVGAGPEQAEPSLYSVRSARSCGAAYE